MHMEQKDTQVVLPGPYEKKKQKMLFGRGIKQKNNSIELMMSLFF